MAWPKFHFSLRPDCFQSASVTKLVLRYGIYVIIYRKVNHIAYDSSKKFHDTRFLLCTQSSYCWWWRNEETVAVSIVIWDQLRSRRSLHVVCSEICKFVSQNNEKLLGYVNSVWECDLYLRRLGIWFFLLFSFYHLLLALYGNLLRDFCSGCPKRTKCLRNFPKSLSADSVFTFRFAQFRCVYKCTI